MSSPDFLITLGFEGTLVHAVNGEYGPVYAKEDFDNTVNKLHLGNYDSEGKLRTGGGLVHLGIVATHSSGTAKAFLLETRVHDCFKEPRQDTELIVGPNDVVPYVTRTTNAPPRRTLWQVLRNEQLEPTPIVRRTTRQLAGKPAVDGLEYIMNVCGVEPQHTVHIGSTIEDKLLASNAGVLFIPSTASAKGVLQLRKPSFAAHIELALDTLHDSVKKDPQ